jgi:hypothetical protein
VPPEVLEDEELELLELEELLDELVLLLDVEELDELLELELLLDVEVDVPGSGSPGHAPVEVMAEQVEPAEAAQAVHRTVVVSSRMPLPKASSMIRLICLPGICVEGMDTVFQLDQPPVGVNRLPNVLRYWPFSNAVTIGVVVAPLA